MNHISPPSYEDSAIEREIITKGLTAPRVSPGDLLANIASEHYFNAADGVIGAYAVRSRSAVEKYDPACEVPSSIQALSILTFCVLVLRNGFTVTGESTCASPENFDAQIGQTIARQNAVQKIWPLMGYALKQKLHDNNT